MESISSYNAFIIGYVTATVVAIIVILLSKLQERRKKLCSVEDLKRVNLNITASAKTRGNYFKGGKK